MQKPYIEEAAELAARASVAVDVLLGDNPGDCEFIPMKPEPASPEWLAELKARWPGRNLRSVAVLAVVNGASKAVFKEPMDLGVVYRLAGAFHTYCLHLALEADRQETPPATQYDWHKRRYVN